MHYPERRSLRSRSGRPARAPSRASAAAFGNRLARRAIGRSSPSRLTHLKRWRRWRTARSPPRRASACTPPTPPWRRRARPLRAGAFARVGRGDAARGRDKRASLRVAQPRAGAVQLWASAGGGQQRLRRGERRPVPRGPPGGAEVPARQVVVTAGTRVDAQHRQVVHPARVHPGGGRPAGGSVRGGRVRPGVGSPCDEVQLRLFARRLRPLQALRQVHHLRLQRHHLHRAGHGPSVGHAAVRVAPVRRRHLLAAELLDVAQRGAQVLNLEGAGGVAPLQLLHVDARRLQLRRHAHHHMVALALLALHLLEQHLQVHLAPLQLQHAVVQVPRLGVCQPLLARARLQRLPQPLVLLLQPGQQGGLHVVVAASVHRR
eukprot:4936750-Pyramimonas_sp.AAC.2